MKKNGNIKDIKIIFESYTEDLGFTMFMQNKQIAKKISSLSIIENKLFLKFKENNNEIVWNEFFEGKYMEIIDNKINIGSCPLRYIGDGSYMFIHKSFQEFFAAQRIIFDVVYVVDDETDFAKYFIDNLIEFKINDKI